MFLVRCWYWTVLLLGDVVGDVSCTSRCRIRWMKGGSVGGCYDLLLRSGRYPLLAVLRNQLIDFVSGVLMWLWSLCDRRLGNRRLNRFQDRFQHRYCSCGRANIGGVSITK